MVTLPEIRQQIAQVQRDSATNIQRNLEAVRRMQEEFPEGVPRSRAQQQGRIFRAEGSRLSALQSSLQKIQTTLERAGEGAVIPEEEAERFKLETVRRGVREAERGERGIPRERLKIRREEIGRRVITREGTFIETAEGRRKISEERVPTPTPISIFDTRTVISPTKAEDFPFESVKDPNVLRRIKTKTLSTLGDIVGLATVSGSALTEVFTESERQLAEVGRFIPIDTSQLDVPKRETLQYIPEFLTDKELEELSFGGLNQLVKRQEAQLNFETAQIIKDAQEQVNPEFQAEIESVINDFQNNKIDESTANSKLKSLEEEYKEKILEIAEPQVDVKTQEVQSYIDAVAKQQRRTRALLLAPIVFGEGYLFGAGIKGVVAGVTALGVPAGVTRIGLPLVALGAAAIQAPQIISAFKKDPIAFLLETGPFVTGAILGSNPQILRKLSNLNKKFIASQKKLLADKGAKAGKSKQAQKQKQVQVQKSESKLKFDRESLKEIIKTSTNQEIKDFLDKVKLDESLTLTQRQQIVATVLEAKSGVSILTEKGAVNFNQLQLAFQQLGAGQRQFQALAEAPLVSPLVPTGLGAGAGLGLGVLEGRIPSGVLDKKLKGETNLFIQKDKLAQSGDNLFITDPQLQSNIQKLINALDKGQLGKEITKQGLNLPQAVSLILSSTSRLEQPLRDKQILLTPQALTSRQQITQIQKNIQRLNSLARQVQNQPQLSGQVSGQINAQTEILNQLQITAQAEAKSQRLVPPIIISILDELHPKARKRVLEKAIEMKLFDAWVRKKGKDIKILNDVPFKEAKKGLRKNLSETLRASGIITEAEDKTKKIKVNLGDGFRKSKIDPLRQVELRNLRLDTSSEVREIHQALKRVKSNPSIINKIKNNPRVENKLRILMNNPSNPNPIKSNFDFSFNKKPKNKVMKKSNPSSFKSEFNFFKKPKTKKKSKKIHWFS